MSDELRPAKPPFRIHPKFGYIVLDADGIAVISCEPKCSLWKDEPLPYHTVCPKCKRTLVSMGFATPQDCEIEVKTTGNNEEIKKAQLTPNAGIQKG